MLDICDRCTARFRMYRLASLALERNCRIVRCPEESCFTLWCLDPYERASLRKIILESGTGVVSFPGTNALPCLFGSGKEKTTVKNGMIFVPPSWFHEKPEWGSGSGERVCVTRLISRLPERINDLCEHKNEDREG